MSSSELVFLVEEAPEGGFTARALGEAIFTEAVHFDQGERPRVIRLHLVRDELLAV